MGWCGRLRRLGCLGCARAIGSTGGCPPVPPQVASAYWFLVDSHQHLSHVRNMKIVDQCEQATRRVSLVDIPALWELLSGLPFLSSLRCLLHQVDRFKPAQHQDLCRTVLWSKISSTGRSKRSVSRLWGSAHGTDTCSTPCVGHLMREIRACRYVRNWQLSRCRQIRSSL